MKLLAIDSNSILNRAYYGVRPLTTKDGIYTNGIYGFLTIFLKICEETAPDAVAFAFEGTGLHDCAAGEQMVADLAQCRRCEVQCLGDLCA